MKLFPLIKHLLLEHKLTIDKSVKDFSDEKLKYANIFIEFVCSYLKLEEECDVVLTNDRSNGISTGGYNPETNKTYILIKNRAPIDYFRTISHELKHQEQRELGQINQGSGFDGSPEENSAHAFAGLMMRKFSEKYPEIYNL